MAFALSGSGNGAGSVSVTFPLPASTLGATLYAQWLNLDTKANAMGVVVSNARKIIVK